MTLRYAAERILIRCPNWIGDMVAATATIRCMRQNYPDAHIALLLEPYTRPVVENAPWFDELVPFDKKRGRMAAILRVSKKLRRPPRYDLALLMTHSFSTSLIAWLGRAAIRVGHAREGRSWLLTDAVPWPKTGKDWKLVPKVRAYAGLLHYLGCEGADDQRPEVFTSAEEETECEGLLLKHRREPGRDLLAIVPGAAFGSSKLWEPVRFASVADTLAERHTMQALILTGPGEGAIGEEIARHMKTQPILFKEGTMTFGQLKGMVRRCALMICNDTGPRHLGIAYNLPVVTLMGPTDPAVTESDYAKTIIVRRPVECGPCYLRKCPTDHKCMKLITPEMVVTAADDLLKRFGPHKPEKSGERPEAGGRRRPPAASFE